MTNSYFDKFIVHKGQYWDVYVSERGGNNLGRIYFWLKRDGIVDYDDLTTKELDELRWFYHCFKLALRELFNFDGPLNFAYLANEEAHGHHCHYHVVPRYKESRSFKDVVFTDVTWGHPWTSAKIDEQLTIAVGKAIMEKAAPLLAA